MVAEQKNCRLLQITKMKPRLESILVVVLQNVPGPDILILCLKEKTVLRSNLKLHLRVRFGTRDLIVRAQPVVIQELGIQGVAEVPGNTKLGSGFANCAAAQISRGGAYTQAISLKEF